jgi:Raf kinase inhibitor-like YbhB/YbcL family protein
MHRRVVSFVLLCVAAALPGRAADLAIRSPAFAEGGLIPSAYGCEGSAGNPAIVFTGVPDGTRSLAVVVDDPDVPWLLQRDHLFVHWVKWDLPPDTRGIAEGKAEGGISEDGDGGYVPPCPPYGEHRYVFKLFALDTVLGAQVVVSRPDDLSRAMAGHILAQAQTTGRYRRRGLSGAVPFDPILLVLSLLALYGLYRAARIAFRQRA